MKVSIIVPIYKVENEIERCLQSVLGQTYDKMELILVNDATPDKSFEIAKEYLANRSVFNKEIVFVEHEVNQGLSVARNSGIKASSGDYLFIGYCRYGKYSSRESISRSCDGKFQ